MTSIIHLFHIRFCSFYCSNLSKFLFPPSFCPCDKLIQKGDKFKFTTFSRFLFLVSCKCIFTLLALKGFVIEMNIHLDIFCLTERTRLFSLPKSNLRANVKTLRQNLSTFALL